ncbi:MAG: ATP-binding cassette domain-containing protein, partial [Hylemonella sp.]
MSAQPPLLQIEGLTIDLPPQADRRHAVQNLSLTLERNQILCIVGESGSGKSLMSRAVLGLFPSRHVQPSAGKIMFDGEDMLRVTPERMRDLRGNRISMIFQEPMTALNPVLSIGAQIEEALAVHQRVDRKARRNRVLDMLNAVNLPDPEKI